MKPRTGLLLLCLLAAGLGAALPTAAKGARAQASATTQKTSLPPSVLAAVDKGDFHAAQDALIAALKGKSITPEDTATLHAAMLLEFIRETDADILSKFSTFNKYRQQFISEFVRDPEWQELYLGAGLVPHKTAMGVDVLFRIWLKHKGNVKNKPLAVALASVWGGGETAPKPALLKRDPQANNPVWRYEFFQKQEAKGKLHPNYKNLRPWELRFTVAIPDQDWDDRSFTWTANNINVPWDRYQWACWAAVYTDPSKFGDDVQTGEYGLPFYTESAAQSTHINGGVCGAMSHLGCFAAMSHGIPSYTCGQPGHCAYAVRPERGKWVGGFGGPDGDMHNHIFGSQAPTSYLLMETVFADDATIDKAYRQSFCARALEATGDKAGAEKMWQEALATSPVHPFFRKQLHRLMLERGAQAEEVFTYLQSTLPAYEGNGLAAVNMMEDLSPVVSGMSDRQKVLLYRALNKVIATTQTSWATDVSGMFAKHAASLSQGAPRERYMAEAFSIYMKAGNGVIFGKALEWAVKEFVEKGEAETFSRAFVKAAEVSAPEGSTGNAEEFKNAMKASYNKAILAAEQARSVPAFQMLVDAAEKALGKETAAGALTKVGEMRGKPAAPKGMFRISSTNQWDKPYTHRNITTVKGGQCHTESEQKPTFVVEVGRSGYLTGCIIRKSDGNEGRMRKATVYTSADGATWMKKAETEDMPKEWAVTFPEGTQGKWVKLEIDNGEGKNFAHISHFVVFVK